jgi:galactose mutarotase-like enzyme
MDELAVLSLVSGDARAEIVPARGALVTSWSIEGREIFYLDRATLLDRSKNVRGGNPVLFPTPGRLAGDRWRRGELTGALSQHGFARNAEWRVEEASETSVLLTLRDDESTRAAYPWSFIASLRYSLAGPRLSIEAKVRCEGGPGPMPFGLGFHPYFFVGPDKSRVAVETGATRAWDNVQKRERTLEGAIDLAHGEVDLHLLDHGKTTGVLQLGDGASVRLIGDAAFTHWVVWTLPEKPFVCLEPWTSPGDALNTGERLALLAPGQSHGFSIAYVFDR